MNQVSLNSLCQQNLCKEKWILVYRKWTNGQIQQGIIELNS